LVSREAFAHEIGQGLFLHLAEDGVEILGLALIEA
jgi:hypothetical protein